MFEMEFFSAKPSEPMHADLEILPKQLLGCLNGSYATAVI